MTQLPSVPPRPSAGSPYAPRRVPLRRARRFGLVVALAFALFFAAGLAQRSLEVTVTNTSPQPISPPILISHSADYVPFAPGAPASAALAALAEEGATAGLAAEAGGAMGAYDVAVADGVLPPGASVTLRIEVREGYEHLSLLGMLVVTNDAFAFWGTDLAMAADTTSDMGSGGEADAMGGSTDGGMGAASTHPPYDGIVRVYDAGSEANSEACAHIPGPPCGSHDAAPMQPGEGHVALHGGILGLGDLDPGRFDWTHPVLTVALAADAM